MLIPDVANYSITQFAATSITLLKFIIFLFETVKQIGGRA
jgi:hypothetical protein